MSQKSQIVSFKQDKFEFQLICKQDAAFAFRENPQIGLDKVLLSDDIYTDAKNGKIASAADVSKMLPADPIRHILLHGHVSLSTEERRKRVEIRLQEIVGQIHSNYVDAKGKPIPHEVVAAAINQLKGLQLDPFAELQAEVEEVIKKLDKADLLRVQCGGMEGVVTCSYDNLSKVQQVIKKLHCQKIAEDFGTDIKLTITVSAGHLDELIKDLEKECKGNFDFKLSGQTQEAAQVEEPGKKKRKGK